MEARERMVQQKLAEISRLSVDLAHARTQHDHVLRDFDEYKVRAQALLRQKDNVLESAQRQQAIHELTQRVTELEADLEEKQQRVEELEEEGKKEKRAGEMARRSFETEKVRLERALLEGEAKIRSLESAQVN